MRHPSPTGGSFRCAHRHWGRNPVAMAWVSEGAGIASQIFNYHFRISVSDEGGGGRGSESKKLPPPLPEIPPEAYATTDKLFGTRTSTVIFSANMAVAPNLVSPSQTPRKPKSEGCSDGSPSADLKTTSTPSMEARTMQRVLIVERDLNVAEGTWSTNIHRHPLAPAPLTSGEEDEVEGWCHGTGAMPLIPPVTLGYGVKGEVADD